MWEGYTGETAKAGDSLRRAPSQVWRSEGGKPWCGGDEGQTAWVWILTSPPTVCLWSSSLFSLSLSYPFPKAGS